MTPQLIYMYTCKHDDSQLQVNGAYRRKCMHGTCNCKCKWPYIHAVECCVWPEEGPLANEVYFTRILSSTQWCGEDLHSLLLFTGLPGVWAWTVTHLHKTELLQFVLCTPRNTSAGNAVVYVHKPRLQPIFDTFIQWHPDNYMYVQNLDKFSFLYLKSNNCCIL